MLYNPCSDVSGSFHVPIFSLCLVVIKIFPSLRHRYDRGYIHMFFLSSFRSEHTWTDSMKLVELCKSVNLGFC